MAPASWSAEPVSREVDVDLELQTRQQEQKRLEEQLSLRLARLRDSSSPPTLVPPLPRPRLPREAPVMAAPVAPVAVTKEAPWQILEETVERVARLESCCLSTVPAMRAQLNHLEQRVGRTGTVEVDDECMQFLREEWQQLGGSLKREVLAEVSKIDASIRGRLSALMDEVQNIRQSKSSPEQAVVKRAAMVAESNSSTLEQVKVLQETLELGIKSEIAGIQGLFDDAQRLKADLFATSAVEQQRVQSALSKLESAQEEVVASTEVVKTLMKDVDERSKGIEHRCQDLRRESAGFSEWQREMHCEMKKNLEKVELRMDRTFQEQETQSAHVEAGMKDVRSEMRSSQLSCQRIVEDALRDTRVGAERCEQQVLCVRSDVDTLRSRLNESNALMDWRTTSQSVEELKVQLEVRLEDLSQGTAGARSGAEVARRLASAAKMNVEELANKQEHAGLRLQEELQKVKSIMETDQQHNREELASLSVSARAAATATQRQLTEQREQREALSKLRSESRSEWEEWLQVAKEAAKHEELTRTTLRLESVIQEKSLKSREVELQLQQLARDTTSMVQEFEATFDAKCRTHLERCESLTSTAFTQAQKDVEAVVVQLQEDVSSILRKAQEQLCDAKRFSDEAQAACTLATSAAAGAEALRCTVEAKSTEHRNLGKEFEEALERQCAKHMELCSTIESTLKSQLQRQNSSFSAAQEEVKALAASLREESRLRAETLDEDMSSALLKAEKQVLQARSHAEEAQATCFACSSVAVRVSQQAKKAEETSVQLKEFVAEQQQALVRCFNELAKVALACGVHGLGIREADSELSQQLAEALRSNAICEDSRSAVDEAAQSSSHLGRLVSSLSGTLTQLRQAVLLAEATATAEEVQMASHILGHRLAQQRLRPRAGR